ncbi:MAG TPA: hypothetical protein VEA63_12595 [Opitutus sp.]|nr:hypothetical protein [Opitutus sp.]
MNKVVVSGWKTAQAKPKRQQSHGSDLVGASVRVLKAKSPESAPAKPAAKPPAKKKLRAVYLRPAKGADSDAKLFLVDEKNRPVIAQG